MSGLTNTPARSDPDTVTVHNRSGDLGICVDATTGLLNGIVFRHRDEEVTLPLELTARLVTEGREVFRPPSELGYAGTVELADLRCDDSARYRSDGPQDTYTFISRAGRWVVHWEYTFREHHPRLELNIEVTPMVADSADAAVHSPATLRDLRLELTAHPEDLPAWRVEAPGNQMRPGVAADALTEPTTVSPAGGLQGSPGLVALHHPELDRTVVAWPFCRTEIGNIRLHSREGALHLGVDTGLAGRLSPTETLRYGTIHLDVLDRPWVRVRDEVATWYGTLGLATPRDRPGWIERANIYEVQIGYSVFRGGYRYEPYPTPRGLLADLGRINGLGYDVLQIMPRQPYPSYNVHDYADITTSYGQEDELRAVVDACHSLGMRVILDILLHGVIDQEVMARTAERVRSGPYAGRLDEDTSGAWGQGEVALDAMNVAWSRHILDFEPYWLEGSPPSHPLAEEHPEWFMRDSGGDIIGIYTKAFDVACVAWQEYFCRAAERLVHRLDIDGFRFDAPTYNALPNWSEATRRRASYSPLGALQLFERIRPRLRHIKDSIVLYTEPSGAAFRQPMDVTYNYDEQWLIPAVLHDAGDGDVYTRRTSVRNGRELAWWFRDRDATLPPGSLTCHHVDSHDTFWWPPPGRKWRREQYGLAATRALLAVFACSGGAYMTFVGGEEGVEDATRRACRLRAQLPELDHGVADYDAVSAGSDAVYAVAHRSGAGCSVLCVNLSTRPVESSLTIDAERLGLGDGPFTVHDAWNDTALPTRSGSHLDYVVSPEALRQLPVTFDAYQVRLLVLRRDPTQGAS